MDGKVSGTISGLDRESRLSTHYYDTYLSLLVLLMLPVGSARTYGNVFGL